MCEREQYNLWKQYSKVQQLPHRIQRREEPRETILIAAAVCLPTGKLFRTLDFVCTLHWSIPYTAHALKLVHTCVRHILNQLQVFRCCSAMLLKNASYRYLKTHVSRLLLKPSFHVWHLARSSSSTVSIYRLAIRLNNFIKPVRCKKCIVGQIWSGAYFPYLNAANDSLEMPVSRLTTSILCVCFFYCDFV